MAVKAGLRFANADWRSEPDAAAEVAALLEDRGFESVWTVDRPAVPWAGTPAYVHSADRMLPDWFHDVDLPDPIVWLAYVASATSRLVLGTGVLVLPLRAPLLLAKQAASLDVLSRGRLRLGVGAGWMREEFEVVGADFESRFAATESAVTALRSAWGSAHSMWRTHGGEVDLDVRPRPRRPIPVLLAACSAVGARRAGRVADGMVLRGGDPEEVARLSSAARAVVEQGGGDPDAFEVTVGVDSVGDVGAVTRAGADRVLLAPPGRDIRSLRTGVDRLARDLGNVG